MNDKEKLAFEVSLRIAGSVIFVTGFALGLFIGTLM